MTTRGPILGRIGQHDAACGLGFFFFTLNHDAVLQGTNLHCLLSPTFTDTEVLAGGRRRLLLPPGPAVGPGFGAPEMGTSTAISMLDF